MNKYIATILFAFLFSNVVHAESILVQYTKEQREQIYSTLFFQPVDTFLTYQAWTDLDIPLLANKLDRAKLAAGSVEFAKLLQPTNDDAKLERRRAIFDELLADKGRLFYELDQMFSPSHSYKVPIADRYHPNYAGPSAPPLREWFSADDESLFISLFDGKVLPDKSVGAALTMGLVTTAMTVLCVGDAHRGVARDRQAMGDAGWMNYINLWRSIFFQVVGGFTMAYQSIVSGIEIASTISEVDAFVLNFGQALERMKRVNEIIQSSEVLANAFPAFADFLKSSEDNALLASSLQSLANRAAASGSFQQYWALKDSIGVYDQIRSLKTEYGKVLWWLGRIDAYLSVIRWMNERESQGYATTFAHHVTNTKRPYFKIKDLTNPVFDRAVPNDFDIDGHVVITGPHALGKTSSIRSLAYAAIMDRSILVVSAKEAQIAPVNLIATYFNTKDSAKESSFEAELRRLTDHLRIAKNSVETDRMLFLIDEPVAKTPWRVGDKIMTRFLNKLIDVPNLSIILSTHLEQPSRIAKERRDVAKNLQPEIDRSSANFVPTYKIVEGAADWWFLNEDNKTDQYIEWLIRRDGEAAELWLD